MLTDCKEVINYTSFRRPPKVSVSYDPAGGMTKQEFKDECDINFVVANFVRHGALSPSDVMARQAMYLDVSDVGDLQEALSKVARAEAGFKALPSGVRERFKNDPLALLEFLGDEKNLEEAVKLGLVDGEAPVKGPASSSSQAAPGSTIGT